MAKAVYEAVLKCLCRLQRKVGVTEVYDQINAAVLIAIVYVSHGTQLTSSDGCSCDTAALQIINCGPSVKETIACTTQECCVRLEGPNSPYSDFIACLASQIKLL